MSEKLPEPIEGKRDIVNRIVKVLEAFAKLTEGTDRRAYALLSGLLPPKDLVHARSMMRTMRDMAKTEKFRNVLNDLLASLDRLMDYFQKSPVFIESMLEEAESEEDRKVIIE